MKERPLGFSRIISAITDLKYLIRSSRLVQNTGEKASKSVKHITKCTDPSVSEGVENLHQNSPGKPCRMPVPNKQDAISYFQINGKRGTGGAGPGFADGRCSLVWNH